MGQSWFFTSLSKKRFFLLITHYFFTIFLIASAGANPIPAGTLDPSWAAASPIGAGKAITPIGTGYDRAQAIVRQPDGKVLVAGYCKNDVTPGSISVNEDFCALRYNENGTLDTTWNGTGTVMTQVSPPALPSNKASNRAYAIALQPDGKVLLAGECGNAIITTSAICTVRYNTDGTLDTTWNGTGKLVTSVGNVNRDSASAIALQADGKVLVAGFCLVSVITQGGICTVRYNTNGTLDTSWNGTGAVITQVSVDYTGVPSGADLANMIAVQPDGKVVVGGICNRSFCAVRYNANGTLDTTWNGTGKQLTPVTTNPQNAREDYAYAMALQPDGKVLLAGGCRNLSDQFCTVRYNADGTLDTNWNGTGKLLTRVSRGRTDIAYAIALQPDGKVLLAGVCSGPDFCAVRYTPTGGLDTSGFGIGRVMTSVGASNSQANAIALQPDGKLILAGVCQSAAGGSDKEDFCAIRYNVGPFGYKACSLDIDGDTAIRFTTDGLLISRYMSPNVNVGNLAGGITLPSNATRTNAVLLNNFLDASNLDFDGDGFWEPTTDGLILLRAMLGFKDGAVTQDIPFSIHATRTDWTAIRGHLVTQCGMQIP
ncbi:MAG: hypothetical protein ACRCWJ_07505 [Casimicrobium sp.]